MILYEYADNYLNGYDGVDDGPQHNSAQPKTCLHALFIFRYFVDSLITHEFIKQDIGTVE